MTDTGEYTPATSEVGNCYAYARSETSTYMENWTTDFRAEFDRWLAGVIADARREADITALVNYGLYMSAEADLKQAEAKLATVAEYINSEMEPADWQTGERNLRRILADSGQGWETE